MTRGPIKNQALLPIVRHGRSEWVPPFILCVLTDPDVAGILGPVVDPVNGHISGPEHFVRTLPPFEIGYLNPDDDGNYAAALRAAHEQYNVPKRLLTLAAQWQLTLMCEGAEVLGMPELVPQLEEASRTVAVHLGADPAGVVHNHTALLDHFGDLVLPVPLRGAFWEIIRFKKIRDILGDANEQEILETCRRYMPVALVHQVASAL